MAYRYNPNKKPLNWFWRNTEPVSFGILLCIAFAALMIVLQHMI